MNTLIVIGVIVAVILIIVVGFVLKFKSETAKMRPAETGKISENGYVIKDDFVNMYLIKDSIGYIAIDAGKGIDNVKRGLQELDIKAEDVIAVLLTHSDMDHVAALPLFKNAKLYMAREEVNMLNGKKQKIPFVNNKMSRSDYILLEDKQTLQIGSHKINCILTEGHSSGSMCFQINEKYLFVGDMLSLHEGKLGSSVKFFDLDHKMAVKSISKISDIPDVEYILTSHWGISKDYKHTVKNWKGQIKN
jgi:glyoxylase-like metal-dependent hydrolase (beta-lactamase superfamily II)